MNWIEQFNKSVSVVNEYHGQYQISKNFTKKELEELAINPKTQSIQFASPLNDKQIDMLEDIVFSNRPDISLRVFGHYGDVCDLSFIQRIPSLRRFYADCLMDATGIEFVIQLKDLEFLGVGIFNLDNFDFLDYINPKIKELCLHQTRSKKPNIKILERFKVLEYLYLEGQQKGIEAISELEYLKKIVLRSISTADVDFLKKLDRLWSVDLKLGGIKDLTGITNLKSLKYLELWQVRGLTDLSFVSQIETLQNLFLQSLRQVEKLPDFSNNKNLRRIYLENLKGLSDLSTLQFAPNLKEFIYMYAGNQEPENLLPVLQNRSLEKISCKFGSLKKNNNFEELIKQFNKHEYDYYEFEYL